MTIGIIKMIDRENHRVVITPTDDDSKLPEKDLNFNYTYQSKAGKTIAVSGMMKPLTTGDKVDFSDWQGNLKFIKAYSGEPSTMQRIPPKKSFGGGSFDIGKERRITYLACMHDGVALVNGQSNDLDVTPDELVEQVLEITDKLFKGVVLRFPAISIEPQV